MLETVPRQGKAEEDTDPLSLRVPKSLLEKVRSIARRQDRSLNAQIVRVLREWAAKEDGEND